MVQYLWLIPFGFAIGACGTLVGAGGAFILVPVLLLLYPHDSSQTVTSISLAVVFFNALSGSIAYARMRRIDYRSGLLFSLVAVPGAVLGALATPFVPRREFDVVLGLVMIIGGICIFIWPRPAPSTGKGSPVHRFRCHMVDSEGNTYEYAYRMGRGLGLSSVVGFLSSLLGIGGGIVHVPALIRLLNFPVHVATATSHFMLAIMALTGTVTHVVSGAFQHGMRRTLLLSVGVVLGAQLGALLSERLRGRLIVRVLAVALGLVGVRLIWMALGPH